MVSESALWLCTLSTCALSTLDSGTRPAERCDVCRALFMCAVSGVRVAGLLAIGYGVGGAARTSTDRYRGAGPECGDSRSRGETEEGGEIIPAAIYLFLGSPLSTVTPLDLHTMLMTMLYYLDYITSVPQGQCVSLR